MITLKSGVGNYINLYGKNYSYFAGNNYLGLADQPELVKAAALALEKYGVNFAASRQTTGTSDIHLELEQLLAEFKGQKDAMVFASGYMGNKLLLDQLKDQYSVIFADAMAHASILDGIPRAFTNVQFYEHCNMAHLEKLLAANKNERPLIVSDGIFALTGEITPLNELHALAEKYNGMVVVDDAHSTGVLGTNGRGTPEHFNLNGAPGIYQSETMSKAIGSYGGFLSGTSDFIQQLRSRSAFYSASTSLPPSVVAAAYASVKMILQKPEMRVKLHENEVLLRNGIRQLGFETSGDGTAIMPIYFKEQQQSQDLSAYLEKNFIIAPSVNYPVKMEKFIVRITVSAIHTEEQIENLINTLKNWRDKHGSNKN